MFRASTYCRVVVSYIHANRESGGVITPYAFDEGFSRGFWKVTINIQFKPGVSYALLWNGNWCLVTVQYDGVVQDP